jgi:hypothetical protein
MELRLLRQPLCSLIFKVPLAGNTAPRRYESSYSRTKKKLNIPPDSTFLSSKLSPQHDHIIFNPPASAPSVLHTPLIFLPKDDKRRKLFGDATASTSSSELPPLVKHFPKHPRHHLTEEDVAEIKRLRSTDPENWTRLKLARRFNCSSHFVSLCCEAKPEKIALEKEKLEMVKARWGPKRRIAREDRTKRREAVYRDE